MNKQLEGKVAALTGGNSGIGLATAKEFAAQGAQVAILVRSQDKLDAALAEIGRGAEGFVGDVTDLSSLEAFYNSVGQCFGGIDILFANAGIGEPTPLSQTDEAAFDRTVGINFKGIFFTVKYALPHLREGASLILVSSCLDEMGVEGVPVADGSPDMGLTVRLNERTDAGFVKFTQLIHNAGMKNQSPYHGYRFPGEVIGYAVWLYHRFSLSFRDVEELLAERGIIVSYEAIRNWCNHFGPAYANKLRKRLGRAGDHWYLDEVMIVTINGERRYLWRAIDQDSQVIDILVQKRKDAKAAKRFFKKMLKQEGQSPSRIITDKLRSYNAARKDLMPSVVHTQDHYANNRCEASHQPTRQQERQMRQFKSAGQLQRFLAVHSRIRNLFCFGRHLLKACHYRTWRAKAFETWQQVTCAC